MRAWLEVLRISNLPTVWTNVLVGVVLSIAIARPSDPSLVAVFVAIAAGSCLYLAGMVFNDVFDVEIDRRERPGRPIPSGRIGRNAAIAFGTVLLGIGVGLPWMHGIIAGSVATGIGLMLLAYDALHARTAWSVLLMGGCRGGLYILGMACLNEPSGAPADDGLLVAVIIGGVAAIHVACFSLIARFEVPDVRETCPECEQIVLSDHAVCPECAGACGPEQRTEQASSRLQRMRSWCGSGTLVLLLPFLGCCGLFGLVSTTKGASYAFGMSDHLAFLLVGANLVSILILGAYLVRSTRGLAEKPHEVGRFVLRSIAVLSLYDAAICGLVALERFDQKDNSLLAATIICIACFFLVRWSHRRIAGT